jgi:hypothetical protein
MRQYYENVKVGEVPLELHNALGAELERGTVSGTYTRVWHRYAWTNHPGCVLELIWHQHDGRSDRNGIIDLFIDRIDASGRYF